MSGRKEAGDFVTAADRAAAGNWLAQWAGLNFGHLREVLAGSAETSARAAGKQSETRPPDGVGAIGSALGRKTASETGRQK